MHSWPKFYSFIKITCFTTLVSADLLSRTVIHIGKHKWAGTNLPHGKHSVKHSPTKLMTMNKFHALVIDDIMSDTFDNEFKQTVYCALRPMPRCFVICIVNNLTDIRTISHIPK